MKSLALLLVVGVLAASGCHKSGEIKMRQRSQRNFGSGLRLSIGDIQLGNSALLTVDKVGDDNNHIGEQVVHAGEHIDIESGGKRYEIEILRFEDHTVSDDFVYLKINSK
jgi:hypothetical protein